MENALSSKQNASICAAKFYMQTPYSISQDAFACIQKSIENLYDRTSLISPSNAGKNKERTLSRLFD